jgi:hypothetical protein
MNTLINVLLKKLTALGYFLGIACLIVGLSVATGALPANAATAEETATIETPIEGTATIEPPAEETATIEPPAEETATLDTPTPEILACSPPGNWGRTVRLYYKSKTQKEWTFQVDEPEMDVTLQFFYFQDYDPDGCPFDCSTGDCQTEEIGEGESPFGSFSVADGQEGASDGTVRQHGRLTQGTYTASFHVTGTGSINIGLKVHKKSVPTATAVPPTATALPPTPAETEAPPTVPPVVTEEVFPPMPTATDIPIVTESAPPETEEVPTATPVEGINPPVDVVTETPTEANPVKPPAKEKTPKPPETLAAPSIPTSVGNPAVLVPETGADLASVGMGEALGKQLFLKLGLALVGIAFVLQGISRRYRPR